MKTAQNTHQKQAFTYILKVSKPFYGYLMVALASSICLAGAVSLGPYLLKVILNQVSACPATATFTCAGLPAIGYLLVTVVDYSFVLFYQYIFDIQVIPQLRNSILTTFTDTLLNHSQRYYQNQFSGGLSNKVNDLADSIPDLLQLCIERFFNNICTLIIAIGTLWYIHFKFALITLVWTVLWIGFAYISSKKLRKLSANWSESASMLTGRIVDVLSNMLSVRLFSRQTHEKALLNNTVQDCRLAEQRLERMYVRIVAYHSFSFACMQVLSLYLLILGRRAGTITVGDFVLILGINTALSNSFWGLVKNLSQFSKYTGRILQALKTILVLAEIEDLPNASPLKVSKGTISFEAVSFDYQGPTQDALFNQQSIVIESGQKVGLVGYSGGGKSTFINLILRLYDITSGRILIDGQDIRSVTQESLRLAIGMIPQEPLLFHRSLMENIRYADFEASDEAVIQATKRAHAHDFILQQPEGYDSLVGERGVKLSGGQRQRVSIARAILKDAPILIMDEATSQLDSITEQHIQDSLWHLMQGKTTLVVAHRLSTLLHMDRILVFDAGSIVEDGTHASLLAQEGLYSKLWSSQVGGFIAE